VLTQRQEQPSLIQSATGLLLLAPPPTMWGLQRCAQTFGSLSTHRVSSWSRHDERAGRIDG
jgi:hypothetical protein